MLDIHTVHSAGAKPGPACYGLGGQEPTITDAAVIMGLLDSSIFLGGRMALDEKLAYEAIETKIVQPLGLSVPEAAYAIYQVALSLMVDAGMILLRGSFQRIEIYQWQDLNLGMRLRGPALKR